MKRNLHLKPRLATLVLAVAALPAVASSDCDAPAARWQSREAVRQMAAQQGWQVERLKIDDGCYEIRGTDAQGQHFKAKLDPETLQVLKIKSRERDDHHKDRDRERERRRDHTPQDAGTAPSSPLFTPGSAPRGQVQ
ncbi:PepSY domain-containing protein [Comamonas flocculans]|uniref:PepSY domain-containing protein n=1 Tax=Comamonas flocculans TaxID=2597701 RepID=A0A5B8RPX2_9BURK|nr:PepSY domain-containing protein [Comamonas flocculans]QEA11721.1 PepSY domain-containing protein [Comamonas flocculans]